MAKRYYCPECEKHFFRETANINQKHVCGEYAFLDWSYEGPADPTASSRAQNPAPAEE